MKSKFTSSFYATDSKNLFDIHREYLVKNKIPYEITLNERDEWRLFIPKISKTKITEFNLIATPL